MDIEIGALGPDGVEAYLDFFDCRAFSDGSPYYPCYCNAFNMSAAEIDRIRERGRAYGGAEGWRMALRETAAEMVKGGRIRGYLAYDAGLAIGWCNANDRVNYARVGEFDLDRVPEDAAPDDGLAPGQVKSIVCFEISPAYRGRGIAARLLERVCDDARREGFAWVEAYPSERADGALAFTGPMRLYERAGFTVWERKGPMIVMRRALP